MRRADVAADVDAAAVGQPGVEHGDVGSGGGMRRSASAAVPASPTTVMSSVGVEQVSNAAPDDLVVVEQERRWSVSSAQRSGICPSQRAFLPVV